MIKKMIKSYNVKASMEDFLAPGEAFSSPEITFTSSKIL
jgi:hypothetical protein